MTNVGKVKDISFKVKGIGLEVNPRYSWDLFINVSVLMYRMFNNVDISSDKKVTRVTDSRE